MSDQEITGQENEGLANAAPEAASAATPVEEAAVKEPEEAPKAPEPVAIGDERIAILKHDIYRKGGEGDVPEAIVIELATKNVSDTPVGSVLFAADLYDIEGNTLDAVEYKTIDLKPNLSRTLRITYSGPKSDKVKSYCVKVAKTALTPEPTATGNEKVTILKHSIIVGEGGFASREGGVDIAIRNISGSTIASAIFEAVFYDIEGNVLDTVQHKELDLKPNTSRGITINCAREHGLALRSYSVKTTRTTTTDVEKVQLRRHEIRTTDAGEEEIRGAVKNISSVKTDAALVATFLNHKKESIGMRVIIIKDIEPDSIKQFHFLFKPQEGDSVRTYILNIGEIAENII